MKKGDGVNNDCDSAEGEEINNGLGMKWAATQENLSWWFLNNKGADQPAHPRSLISVFVFCLFESIISGHITSEISLFWLVSVAEETGLSLAMWDTPKTGFLATRPNL